MAPIGPAASCGSTSVIHTKRVRPSGSATTCALAWWCAALPPTTV